MVGAACQMFMGQNVQQHFSRYLKKEYTIQIFFTHFFILKNIMSDALFFVWGLTYQINCKLINDSMESDQSGTVLYHKLTNQLTIFLWNLGVSFMYTFITFLTYRENQGE